MSADFTPEKEDYKILTPFKMQVLTNFPYIEADFDALTNYQLLCKIVEYLNEVITNENEVTEQITSLYNAYVLLQGYVNSYFDNLDVQQEINNKLDEMAIDGSLTNLIKNYVDPIYQSYERSINSQISEINSKVESATSGSPLVASSTDEMTETDRVYVNTSNGKWYYYDGDSWEIGGTYQSTGIDQNDDIIKNIKKSINIENYITSPTQTGKILDTHGSIGSVVDITNFVVSPSGLDCYLITCNEGDYYTITGTGSSTGRLWCFLDEDNKIISKSIPNLSVSNLLLETPTGATHLIINTSGTRYIIKGIDVNNRIKELEYLKYNANYKANAGVSSGSEISYTSHESGLYNFITHETYASATSYYNIYNIKSGQQFYATGRSGGVGTSYCAFGFLDDNDNAIATYGTSNQHTYTDMLLEAPSGSVKLIINGGAGATMTLKEAIPFNKTLAEVYNSQNPNPLPEELYYKRLGNKQVGVFSKPYICFSCDDGAAELYSNTIPNILEKVHDDTTIYVPFTFALMSTSNVLNDETKLASVLDMIENKNCSVAYHGSTSYTSYNSEELIDYLDAQETALNALGIYPKGVVYPNHAHNDMVMTICGAREGVACAGGSGSQSTYYTSPRKNMYEIYRTSLLNMSVSGAKTIIDTAYANNYLVCFFFHDHNIYESEKTDDIVEIIEYAITKGMNFCTIGDIPNLI